MLDFLERHKIGILATIVFHLLLITVFLVVQLTTLKPKKETQVLIDFELPEDLQKEIKQKQEEVKKLNSQEFIKSMQQEYVGHNIAVNEADNSRQNIEKMVNDIKNELNINDKRTDNNPEDQKPLQKIEPVPLSGNSKPAYTTNEKGERTFYKGATTITYFLEGRTDVYIPVPVYKCQGGGKVSLEIEVDKNGYVIKATINKKESVITDECYSEAATNAALTTRFNAKGTAPDRQAGRISYIFVAQ
jgi:hypothetical protein